MVQNGLHFVSNIVITGDYDIRVITRGIDELPGHGRDRGVVLLQHTFTSAPALANVALNASLQAGILAEIDEYFCSKRPPQRLPV